MDEGALGIGLGIAYVPLATRAEILELFELAAQRKTTIYVHMRNGGPLEPGVIDALQEMIADAAATGASVHVVHITSMGLRETALCLAWVTLEATVACPHAAMEPAASRQHSNAGALLENPMHLG